jgi:hypothetical protein
MPVTDQTVQLLAVSPSAGMLKIIISIDQSA